MLGDGGEPLGGVLPAVGLLDHDGDGHDAVRVQQRLRHVPKQARVEAQQLDLVSIEYARLACYALSVRYEKGNPQSIWK